MSDAFLLFPLIKCLKMVNTAILSHLRTNTSNTWVTLLDVQIKIIIISLSPQHSSWKANCWANHKQSSMLRPIWQHSKHSSCIRSTVLPARLLPSWIITRRHWCQDWISTWREIIPLLRLKPPALVILSQRALARFFEFHIQPKFTSAVPQVFFRESSTVNTAG